MLTRVTIVFFVAALGLIGCSSPEGALERAQRSKDSADIQYVIDRYPESPEASVAADYLVELAAWGGVADATEPAPYREFLAAWPDGLFAADAKSHLRQITLWDQLASSATVESVGAYIDQYPNGLFNEEASERREVLMNFAERFESLAEDADLASLTAAAKEMSGSGYAQQLWSRIETAVASDILAGLAAEDEFSDVDAAAWQDLNAYIAGAEGDDLALARRAREKLEIAKVDVTNGGARFTLPGIAVHGLSKPSRFAISDDVPGEGDKLQFQFGGGITEGPPEEEICFRSSGSLQAAFAFTEFDEDTVPLYMQGLVPFSFVESGNPGFIRGTGTINLDELQPIHCSAGTVWRVYGEVGIVPDHRIKGDAREGLSFYLVEDVGAVYLAGRGEVTNASGERIFGVGLED